MTSVHNILSSLLPEWKGSNRCIIGCWINSSKHVRRLTFEPLSSGSPSLNLFNGGWMRTPADPLWEYRAGVLFLATALGCACEFGLSLTFWQKNRRWTDRDHLVHEQNDWLKSDLTTAETGPDTGSTGLQVFAIGFWLHRHMMRPQESWSFSTIWQPWRSSVSRTPAILKALGHAPPKGAIGRNLAFFECTDYKLYR